MSVGIDIVEIDRIARLIKQKAFLQRVFSEAEQAYCAQKKNKAQHYAVRFAAKEAVWKSLNKSGVALVDITVKNLPSGKPVAYVKGKRVPGLDISLSHADSYAAAVAFYNR